MDCANSSEALATRSDEGVQQTTKPATDKAWGTRTHFNLTNIALLRLLIRLVLPAKGVLDTLPTAAKTNATIHRSIGAEGCGG